MTENLGDRIRARRQQRIDSGAPARAVVLATAKTYVDNQIVAAKAAVLATAKTYVDNQIDAVKTYVDNKIAAKIAKLAADNGLVDSP